MQCAQEQADASDAVFRWVQRPSQEFAGTLANCDYACVRRTEGVTLTTKVDQYYHRWLGLGLNGLMS